MSNISNSEGTTENSFYIKDEDTYIKYLSTAVSNNHLQGKDDYGTFPLATILDHAYYHDTNSYSVSNTSYQTTSTMPTHTALYTGTYIFQVDFRYDSSSGFNLRMRTFINGSGSTLFDIDDINDGGSINKRMLINLTAGDAFYSKVRVASSSSWRSVDIDDVFFSLTLYRF